MDSVTAAGTQRRIIAGAAIAKATPVAGTLFFAETEGEAMRDKPEVPVPSGKAAVEIDRVETEISTLVDEIEAMAAMLKSEGFKSESDILTTHLLMLKDGGLRAKVLDRIETYGDAAETAVARVFGELQEGLSRSENTLVSEKSADVKDLMQRIRSRLSGGPGGSLAEMLDGISSPVLVYSELLVSQILEARAAGVKAIIVGSGTGFSHAAIMAKAFGIPVLRIDGIEHLYEFSSSPVVADMDKERLILNPVAADMPDTGSSVTVASETTVVESPLNVWLNLVDPTRSPPPESAHIRGIGLYRSEFLLTERASDFPSEEEQFAVYGDLCTRWHGYPVTIRTFDIGGDKMLPYLSLGPQQNPYLGLRAHRLYRYHPELFITQLKAILRAATPCGELRILYPMIETLEELLYLQSLLDRALDELERDGVEFQRQFKQGVLIEVPSALWTLKELLEWVDFISVGTNDLLQYHFAVDRGNANVSSYYQPEHPSALRMLKQIADTAAEAGKKVTLCGEIAADPRLVPLLYGLGFHHLSIDAHAVDAVRRSVPRGSQGRCEELAAGALAAATSGAVRTLLAEYHGSDQAESSNGTALDLRQTDPVCGMQVHREENPFFVNHHDHRYYFCSSECMRTFSARPEAYAP